MTIEFGSAGEIADVVAVNTGDEFENAIRKYGVVAACEWFGYESDSYFTKSTILVLIARSNARN